MLKTEPLAFVKVRVSATKIIRGMKNVFYSERAYSASYSPQEDQLALLVNSIAII